MNQPRPTAGAARPPHARQTAVPTLDLSRPRRQAVLALSVLLGLCAMAALVPITTVTVTTASGRTHAEPTVVRHGEGGVVAKLHVREGDDIAQGARLLSFDTRLLDSQIAGLRRQINGIRLHIDGLKEEAGGLATADRNAPQRQRLGGIEAQIATAEQEVLGLEVRLAMASEERGRTDVFAPLPGRVVKLLVAEAAGIQPGTALAAIQPAPDRLTLETTIALDRRVPLQAGQAVEIREASGAAVARFLSPATAGRIDAVTGEDARGVHLRIVADLPGDPADMNTRERRFTVRLVTGAESLLDRFAHALAVPAQASAIATSPIASSPVVRFKQVSP